MSTNIYLIRHGESEGNLYRRFLGHCDLELTEKGFAQARATAQYLKDIKVDAIYSSDLQRAFCTAKCTAELVNLPIVTNQKLREIFAGKWENRSYDEIEVICKDSLDMWRTNFGRTRCEGGESVVELEARVMDVLTEIAEAHDGETVLVFTHATPIRVFAAHCLELEIDEYQNLQFSGNASVTHAIYENGKFLLLEYGKNDFMGDLAKKSPPVA